MSADSIARLRAWDAGSDATKDLPITYSAGSRLFAMDVSALLEAHDAAWRAGAAAMRERAAHLADQWAADAVPPSGYRLTEYEMLRGEGEHSAGAGIAAAIRATDLPEPPR